MRIGRLIPLLSTTYGLHEARVTIVARAMREAGWISTGARGVNAPEMNAQDVARLTLALLSGEPASKVVAEFEILRSLQTKTVFPKEGFVPQDHTFEDLITALFAEPRVRRECCEPRFSVAIDISRRNGEFETPSLRAVYGEVTGANHGMRRIISICQDEFKSITDAMGLASMGGASCVGKYLRQF